MFQRFRCKSFSAKYFQHRNRNGDLHDYYLERVRDIVSKLFFAEEENHTQAPRWASNLWPLHVNVDILSRSPQETDDFTGMLENDEIKHKI